MLIWSLKKKSISVVNIVLKKYIYEIHFMLYIFSILIWYKCKIIPQLLWIYAFEMLIFYMILENEAIKVFDYKYLCDLQIPLHRITDSASNGSVFPVVTEHFSASSDHAFL